MQIEMTKNRWGLLAAFVAAIALLLYVSWPAPPAPNNSRQIVDDGRKALEAQYKEQLKEKDAAVKDLRSRLSVSESKYQVIVRKFQDLQKEKEDVQPPKTNAELRDRFVALGFPPVPGK
jgi:hypothetical protein